MSSFLKCSAVQMSHKVGTILIRMQCIRSMTKLRGKWRVGRLRRTVLLVMPNSISITLNMEDAIPLISPAPDTVVSAIVSLRLARGRSWRLVVDGAFGCGTYQ